MIRIAPTPEPANFDETCRKPGNQWLEAHPDAERPYPYWRDFEPDLRRAFHGRCAYLGIYIATGTCDHFKTFKGAGGHALAYEWSNYRYCDQAVNSAKKPSWDAHLIDPFDVDDAWFEVLLPSCEFQIIEENIPHDPPGLLERVRFTVDKLGLKSERVVNLRLEWLKRFEENEVTWEGLSRFAPLLAQAIKKSRGPLNHTDSAIPMAQK